MGMFKTDFDDQEALETDLLGGSLASVKEKMREENKNHVVNIDKKDRAELEESKKQYLNGIMYGQTKFDFDEEKGNFRTVKLEMNKNLALLFELSSLVTKFKVRACINNLIDDFVENNREEINHLIEASREHQKLFGK